jgi:hypothetical protein
MFDLSKDGPKVEAARQVTGASGSEVKAYTYRFKTLTMGGVTVTSPRIELTKGAIFWEVNLPRHCWA